MTRKHQASSKTSNDTSTLVVKATPDQIAGALFRATDLKAGIKSRFTNQVSKPTRRIEDASTAASVDM